MIRIECMQKWKKRCNGDIEWRKKAFINPSKISPFPVAKKNLKFHIFVNLSSIVGIDRRVELEPTTRRKVQKSMGVFNSWRGDTRIE